MEAENEASLLARARAGDRQALAALTAAHRSAAYRLAHAYLRSAEEAADAVADVCARLFAAPERLPRDDFRPWLLRVVANHCRDLLRRRGILARLLPRLHALASRGPDPSPEQAALAADERAAVQGAVARLPEQERLVVVLRFYHQLSYAEIGRVLDVPEATVGTRLHRAREKLRRMLAGTEGKEGEAGCAARTTGNGNSILTASCRPPAGMNCKPI